MAIGHTYFFYELSAIFNVFGFSFFISQLGLMIFALSFELQEKKKKDSKCSMLWIPED